MIEGPRLAPRADENPTDGTGRAELYDLPVFVAGAPVQEKTDDRSIPPSSFKVAVGARYAVEQKIPGRQIGFVFLDDACRISSSQETLLAAYPPLVGR